jgi:hypothetical protein
MPHGGTVTAAPQAGGGRSIRDTWAFGIFLAGFLSAIVLTGVGIKPLADTLAQSLG